MVALSVCTIHYVLCIWSSPDLYSKLLYEFGKNVYIFIQIIIRVLESIIYILQNDPIYIFEYNFVRKINMTGLVTPAYSKRGEWIRNTLFYCKIWSL